VSEEQYDKLASPLCVVMLHLLKRDHQPDRRSRSRTLFIREQGQPVQRELHKNPGLKPLLDEAISEAFEDARDEASSETGLPLTTFPATRPYEYSEIMERPVVWPGDEG
jgi:Domain of unknown function DUF29